MSEVTDFFRMQQKNILSIITTSLLCKVLSYDESNRTAKLQPLYKDDDGPFAVLEDVPVLRQRFRVVGGTVQEYIPILQTSDVVCVVFSKFPLDDALNGRITNQSENMYRAHDAIVVGVL